MNFTNTDYTVAIGAAQDIVIALVMHAMVDLTAPDDETKKIEENLRRSRRELDAAFKRLIKKDKADAT